RLDPLGRYRSADDVLLTAIVATREQLLQPDIEHDEEIAAAHLLDLQLGNASRAVVPVDRHGGVGVAARDRLERQLDRDIEVRREERLYPLDHLTPIGLEGVGRVVEMQ